MSIGIGSSLIIVTVMDDLNGFKAYGESFSLKDEEQQKFIREQQAIQREERHAERDLKKKRLWHEAEKEKLLVVLERNYGMKLSN